MNIYFYVCSIQVAYLFRLGCRQHICRYHSFFRANIQLENEEKKQKLKKKLLGTMPVFYYFQKGN